MLTSWPWTLTFWSCKSSFRGILCGCKITPSFKTLWPSVHQFAHCACAPELYGSKRPRGQNNINIVEIQNTKYSSNLFNSINFICILYLFAVCLKWVWLQWRCQQQLVYSTIDIENVIWRDTAENVRRQNNQCYYRPMTTRTTSQDHIRISVHLILIVCLSHYRLSHQIQRMALPPPRVDTKETKRTK